MINQEFKQRFLTRTDDTGRFIVYSPRTGKQYFVEAVGDPHTSWGSVDPSDSGANGKLMHKKGDGKYRGSIDEEDSLITLENGFAKVHNLEPGMSPHSYIEYIDKQYPDKAVS